MRQHLFLALTDPTSGREADFNTWYDQHHIQDVVDFCPGFVRGRRYWRVSTTSEREGQSWQSIALYDLEADDVAALHANVFANVSRFTPGNGVYAPDHAAWVYTPVHGGPIPAFEQGCDDSRIVIFAFFDSDPSTYIEGGSSDAIILERSPDQREGQFPTWRYLVARDVPADQAEQEARRIGSAEAPAALWIYSSRGELHVSNADASRAIVD